MIGLSPRSTLFPYTTLFRSLLLVTVTDEEEPDAWYPHQLVGLPVEHVDGRALGTVAGVEHLPAQDALMVAEPGGQRTLVPLDAQIVPGADISARRLALGPTRGLLATSPLEQQRA